jgi:1-acyl-sn-glycerol-3-phosphate acyltransferase
MIKLRSLVFNVAFYVNLVVLMIGGLPLILRGRHGVFFMARLWGGSSIWLLERICGLRVEYRGLENIPKTGYILAAKHESFLETFALLEHAPDFAIILKRQLVFIPLFGLYLVGGRQIAIDRSQGRSALAQIIAQAREVVRAGRQVLIFPEGTRRPPGAPPRYKFGVAAIYAETGAPCLPVAVNTGLFWGRRGFTRRPGVAVIEYLPPILPGLDREAFATQLQAAIEKACARLNAEAVAADPRLAPVLAAGGATVDAPAGGGVRREA